MIEEIRHHHPHIDPRQPRDGSSPRTNPPVFAWKPPEGAGPFGLTVARDEAMHDVVLQVDGLDDPMMLPERAFERGRYFWTWTTGSDAAPAFSFEITADAVELEVPSAEQWLARLSAGHPRIYLRSEEVGELRDAVSSPGGGPHGKRAAELYALAEELH